MKYEIYIKQPMQLVDLKLNMINDNKLHLINALYRTLNHPSTRKYTHIPFRSYTI